ncbi:MAG: cytochrome c maturation protein CcmE [Alphaproteobacteria bacterium]|nr:cytochrome c maturation protein CcmE [Alphaproteobacteria bacterium]
MTPRLQRLLLAAAAVSVLGGTLGALSMSTMGEELVYYWSPTELHAKGDAARDATVRIMGMVVDGSVEWMPEEQRLAFRVTDGSEEVAVEGTGAPPQMFREGIGVVVEGRLHADGVFRSQTVMVKHDNAYAPPAEGEMPDEVYRALQASSAEGT